MLRRWIFFLLMGAVAAPSAELRQRMNAFAEVWNRFVVDLERGLFDAAKAKALTRLFGDIERSGEWPTGK